MLVNSFWSVLWVFILVPAVRQVSSRIDIVNNKNIIIYGTCYYNFSSQADITFCDVSKDMFIIEENEKDFEL